MVAQDRKSFPCQYGGPTVAIEPRAEFPAAAGGRLGVSARHDLS